MFYLFKAIAILIIIIASIATLVPQKVFEVVWQGWNIPAWRKENLKLWEVAMFIFILRIIGIWGIINGLWLLIFTTN